MKNSPAYPFDKWRRDMARRFRPAQGPSEGARPESPGPAKVVAAVATGSLRDLATVVCVMAWAVAASWMQNYSTAGVCVLLALALMLDSKKTAMIDEAISLAIQASDGWKRASEMNTRLLAILQRRSSHEENT